MDEDDKTIDETIDEDIEEIDPSTVVKVQVNPEHCIYYDGILLDNLVHIKRDTIKKNYDTFLVQDGREGCLAEGTLIQINRCKVSRLYSIKKLYNCYHPEDIQFKFRKGGNQWDKNIPCFVRSYNGKDIRLNKIKDVTYSGKKKVFKLVLENGYNIKVTLNHKIMTRDGWVELQDLKQNVSEVMCDTLKAEKKNRIRIKLYDILLKVRNHPYANIAGRVEVHRLIYEAHKNNLHFTEYLDLLLNEPYKLNKEYFVNPSIYNIHHKDGNHYNNSIDNLELLTIEEHRKLKHSNNIYQNFSQGVPKFSKVNYIEPVGIEDTFDIQCEEPIHNFTANGMVVHNSGKTTFSFQIAMYLDPTFCLDRVCFTIEQFVEAVEKAEKYQAIVFDETMGYLSSRSSMSRFNRLLIKVFSEMRSKNLFILLNIPSIFELDKYPAIHRSVALIHIYKRGTFAVYNYSKKKLLYINGKKFYSYAYPAPDFIGRFAKYFPLNYNEYENKKQRGIANFNIRAKVKASGDVEKKKKEDGYEDDNS